jgi:hypothetical protein
VTLFCRPVTIDDASCRPAPRVTTTPDDSQVCCIGALLPWHDAQPQLSIVRHLDLLGGAAARRIVAGRFAGRAKQHFLNGNTPHHERCPNERRVQALQERGVGQQLGDQSVLPARGDPSPVVAPFAAASRRIGQMAGDPWVVPGATEGEGDKPSRFGRAALQPLGDNSPVGFLAHLAAFKGRPVRTKHGVGRVRGTLQRRGNRPTRGPKKQAAGLSSIPWWQGSGASRVSRNSALAGTALRVVRWHVGERRVRAGCRQLAGGSTTVSRRSIACPINGVRSRQMPSSFVVTDKAVRCKSARAFDDFGRRRRTGFDRRVWASSAARISPGPDFSLLPAGNCLPSWAMHFKSLCTFDGFVGKSPPGLFPRVRSAAVCVGKDMADHLFVGWRSSRQA